jgi:hypothetical protein
LADSNLFDFVNLQLDRTAEQAPSMRIDAVNLMP